MCVLCVWLLVCLCVLGCCVCVLFVEGSCWLASPHVSQRACLPGSSSCLPRAPAEHGLLPSQAWASPGCLPKVIDAQLGSQLLDNPGDKTLASEHSDYVMCASFCAFVCVGVNVL